MIDWFSELSPRTKWFISIVAVLLLGWLLSYRLSDIRGVQPYPGASDYQTHQGNPQIVFTTTDDSNKLFNFYNNVFGGFGLFNGGGVSTVSVGKERYEVTEIDYYWSWLLFYRDVRIMVYPTDKSGVNEVLIRTF